MAEDKKQGQKKETKQEQKPEEIRTPKQGLISKEVSFGKIIRILQTDVPADKSVYAGLTRIRGVSWPISNAVCINLKLDRKRKIDSLSKEEILKIEEELKKGNFPKFLLNRRNDFTTGESIHLLGSNLDLSEELDIKRLKKIRSFRGYRHAMGQPTRGQSTKSHFRVNRKKGVGVRTKAKIPTAGGKA
jgi:small subunit ribosomal protein S13